jgi:hypothetical protein
MLYEDVAPLGDGVYELEKGSVIDSCAVETPCETSAWRRPDGLYFPNNVDS